MNTQHSSSSGSHRIQLLTYNAIIAVYRFKLVLKPNAMMGQSSSSTPATKEAFSALLGELIEKNVKPTKDQHFLAAERWRFWACVVDYSSTTITLGGAAISAGALVRAMQRPDLKLGRTFSLSFGILLFSAPIAFSPQSFHYHPRSLYNRHMQAASEYQLMQQQMHGLRRIILSQNEETVFPAILYSWFDMLLLVKKHVDIIEKPWNCDYQEIQSRKKQ